MRCGQRPHRERVSICQADLGLAELRVQRGECIDARFVSICQADLGLAEHIAIGMQQPTPVAFQSARQICVGLNAGIVASGLDMRLFQSARQICVGLNCTNELLLHHCVLLFQSARQICVGLNIIFPFLRMPL